MVKQGKAKEKEQIGHKSHDFLSRKKKLSKPLSFKYTEVKTREPSIRLKRLFNGNKKLFQFSLFNKNKERIDKRKELIKEYRQWGNQWKKISLKIKGNDEKDVKNQFFSIVRVGLRRMGMLFGLHGLSTYFSQIKPNILTEFLNLKYSFVGSDKFAMIDIIEQLVCNETEELDNCLSVDQIRICKRSLLYIFRFSKRFNGLSCSKVDRFIENSLESFQAQLFKNPNTIDIKIKKTKQPKSSNESEKRVLDKYFEQFNLSKEQELSYLINKDKSILNHAEEILITLETAKKKLGRDQDYLTRDEFINTLKFINSITKNIAEKKQSNSHS